MDHTGQLQPINLIELHQSIQDQYKNFIVSTANESCLRMAVFSGEYPWHRHPTADELFLVLEGELIIDFQDRDSVTLTPIMIFTVPAGVIHRTRAKQRTVNLCFEQTTATTELLENL